MSSKNDYSLQIYPDAQVHTTVSFFLLQLQIIVLHTPMPLNCTKRSRLRTSLLDFSLSSNQILDMIMSMFHIFSQEVIVKGNSRNYVFVRKNYLCANSLIHNYFMNVAYLVKETNRFVCNIVMDVYGGSSSFSNFKFLLGRV